MVEEIDVIVASLLDILLRTILEITSRPQASGSATRLHFQDVTVSPRPTAMGWGVCCGNLGSGRGCERENFRQAQQSVLIEPPCTHRVGRIMCKGSRVGNREGSESRDGGCGMRATRVPA